MRVCVPGRLGHIVSGILFNLIHACDKINLFKLFDRCLVNDLPPKVQHREHENHRVREEECWDIPVAWLEDLVPADNSHNTCCHKSDVGDVWLEVAFVRQRVAGNTLRHESLAKAGVCEGDDGVVDELRCGDLFGQFMAMVSELERDIPS